MTTAIGRALEPSARLRRKHGSRHDGRRDGGPILRRSQAALTPWDTPEACFARVVALGTELMCEAVTAIIECQEVVVYDQPLDRGVAHLSSQLDGEIEKAVERDFSNGWLGDAIRGQRQF